MGILIGVFSVVIFMDWRFYRIPNPCVCIGAVAGMIMTFMSYSIAGVASALVSMLIIFMAFYPFYLLGGIGAGDVKLFMMVGCYIQGEALLRYLAVTMLIASAVSILKMIVYAESRERLFYLGRYIRKAVLTGAIDVYEIDRTQKRCVIRLSIPALLSLVLMCMEIY